MTQFGWSSTGTEVVEAFKNAVSGRTIVITGASKGGLGAETALSLAHGNPKQLILAGRTEEKVKPVIEEITQISPSVQVTFVQMDLGSMASVRRAAAAINHETEKIDILINNAAIMASPYATTDDGIESQFATNYLGHFLLTNLLMAKLLLAAPGTRVVNVTSNAGLMGEIHWDDINFNDGKEYNPIAAYGQSKIASIMFSASLASRLNAQGLSSFSAHPGYISTSLQKYFQDPAVMKESMDYVESRVGGKYDWEEKKTLQEGCSTTLVAALDSSIIGSSGGYLADGNVIEEQPKSVTDLDMAERLWALSEKLVNQEFNTELEAGYEAH